MGTTESNFDGEHLTFRDGVTGERVLPVAPVVFHDDFLGADFSMAWDTYEASAANPIALAIDVANGAVEIQLDAANDLMIAVLNWGDQMGINIKHNAVFECRVKMAATPGLNVSAVWGLGGGANSSFDAVRPNAWFRLEGGADLLCESDDNGSETNDDVPAGETLAESDYHICRIDFSNLADVRFFVDGLQVATGTTFDMSAIADGDAVMQPIIGLIKTGGTGTGSLLVDFVRIWSNRSE